MNVRLKAAVLTRWGREGDNDIQEFKKLKKYKKDKLDA